MFSIPKSVCLPSLEKSNLAKVDRRPALAGGPRLDEAYAAHSAIQDPAFDFGRAEHNRSEGATIKTEISVDPCL